MAPTQQANPTADRVLDVVIVGAGFAGLYMLHRARKMGLAAHVYEAGSDVGGTWYWNRYPGARCDVDSLQYSYSWDPELEQEWEWTERFATQPEILAYINHVADRHDLRRDITFGTRIASAHYDEGRNIWTVTTVGGETVAAQFVMLATGCLSAAQVPDIPGRDDFAGATYHTGEWPHEGVDFTGKRVAVIGTGSSGIQVIPEIAKQAKHLAVYQRTPNYSIPARNRPLDQDEIRRWKENAAELRRKAREETPAGTIYDFATKSALEVDEDERERTYHERWEKGGANFSYSFNDLILDEAANRTAADFVRDRIRDIVKDPETAESLCPTDYPIFTKRICVDDHYFEVFNRDSVELVDLRKHPIERIEKDGIRTADGLRTFDAIVYATGFDAITGAITAIDIRGRDGLTLKDKWREGPKAYLGLATEGFPNLFMITGPGSPSVLSNVIVSIEQHVDWLTRLLSHMRETGEDRVEATRQAEENWADRVRNIAEKTLLPKAATWYMGANIPGKPRVFMPFMGVHSYRRICNEIAADGYRGFVLDRAGDAGQQAARSA